MPDANVLHTWWMCDEVQDRTFYLPEVWKLRGPFHRNRQSPGNGRDIFPCGVANEKFARRTVTNISVINLVSDT